MSWEAESFLKCRFFATQDKVILDQQQKLSWLGAVIEQTAKWILAILLSSTEIRAKAEIFLSGLQKNIHFF